MKSEGVVKKVVNSPHEGVVSGTEVLSGWDSTSVFLSLCLVLGLILSGAGPSRADDLESYREKFVEHWRSVDQIPDTPASRDDYVNPAHFDVRHGEAASRSFAERITEFQNTAANMAWGSSYQMQALNDMYVATGDLKYLRWNLEIARSSMGATDEVHGRETFYGQTSPAWGTAHYREEYTVHVVHTGMITWGLGEFIHLARTHGEELGFHETEQQEMLKTISRALDFHQRQWVSGPGEDEGTWILMDEVAPHDGKVVPLNMMSAMALAHWWSWKNTGSEQHHQTASQVARYIKNRLPIYEKEGLRAYFWNYWLGEEPVSEVRSWSELSQLRGGEDFSHAVISMAFPVQMAYEGMVFGKEDLGMFRNTVFHGFGHLPDGLMTGNVAGDTRRNGPSDVQSAGYWLALTEHSPEVYGHLLPFFLNYQARPRNLDLAKLIRYGSITQIREK